MTAEGIQYVATVAAASMAVVCLACGFCVLYAAWKRRADEELCEACGGIGHFPLHGEDGRIDGGRYHCDCQRLPVLIPSDEVIITRPGQLIDMRI